MATAAHYLILLQLLYLDCPAPTATTIGALVGALVNYGLQHRFTFASQRGHRSAFFRYAVMSTLSCLLNLILFSSLHFFFSLSVLTAQVLTTLWLALCNYWVSKRYVFL